MRYVASPWHDSNLPTLLMTLLCKTQYQSNLCVALSKIDKVFTILLPCNRH